jgi:N-acetylneuraminic acid mutarotase
LKKLQKMFFAFVFVFLTASCTFMVPNVSAASYSADTWTATAPLPTGRTYLGVATVDGKIYAIGGDSTDANEMYDPANNTWTTKKPMLKEVTTFCAVAYKNKIYCLGSVLNEVYDTQTDSWEMKTPIPTHRFYASANVVNDKIYVISGRVGGGWAPLTCTNVTEMYDPATDTWTTMTPMPETLQYNESISIDSNMVSIVLDNKIYVFGSTHVQIFDPQTNSWTIGPPSTIGAGYWAGAATTGAYAPKKLYIFNENCAQIFDPQTENWSNSALMPEHIRNFGVAIVDDVFYVISGQGIGPKIFQGGNL